VERSTRLSILEHALADVAERLEELPPSQDADALRALARQYETERALWEEHPPDEETRAAVLESVLELSVRVIKAPGATPRPPPEQDPDEDPGEDDFPKVL
jgi:hypothetical protein